MSVTDHAELLAQARRHFFEQDRAARLITDADNRIVAVNAAFSSLTGYTADEVIGRDPRLLASGHTTLDTYVTMWDSLTRRDHWVGDLWDRRKDGTTYLKHLAITRLRTADGSTLGYTGDFSEVNLDQATAERFQRLAAIDSLTQLPNRAGFESQFELLLSTCARQRQQAALLLIDLDQFKTINDTLGHSAGDELLREVAARLRSTVRASDVVARLGGDEFAIVLADIDGAGQAGSVVSKLQRALAGYFRIGEHRLYTTPSIGVSLFPHDGLDGESLLRNADTAMYRAKDAGRNTVRFYAAEMNARAGERLQIESALHQAIATMAPGQAQFALHYQPQIDACSGRLIGVEALIRWTHPTLGNVPPDRFIGIAEAGGLILPLGDWVFWEACRFARTLKERTAAAPRVAINLSAQQLRHDGLLHLVRGALACYDLQPDDIELEITESTAMRNPETMLGILNELAGMGVPLAIDDFGTGYSSLAYLKHMPIKRLKIDRAFVKDIETDVSSRAISAATIELGHRFGLELVAEGVENASQRAILRDMGCDVLQGYLFGRPMPETALLDRLARPHLNE